MTKIGYIGLGAMGKPMAKRLVGAYAGLSVWNRSPAPAEELVSLGAVASPSPSQLAEGCDVIVSCLLGAAAIEEVYFGTQGLFEGLRPGTVVVEHATFAPSLATQISARADEKGVIFVDAPVSGGAAAAERGTLSIMAGTDSLEAPNLVAPVFSHYASVVEWIGPSGAGLTLKLINQMLVSIHTAAAGEAAAVIDALGFDQAAATRALSGGWAGSTMLDRCLPIIFEGDLTASSNAPIGGLSEAQQLLSRLAKSHGLSVPVFDRAHEQFRAAQNSDIGNQDLAALTLLNRASAISTERLQ